MLLLVTLVTMLLVTACGGDAGQPAKQSSEPSTAHKEVVLEYSGTPLSGSTDPASSGSVYSIEDPVATLSESRNFLDVVGIVRYNGSMVRTDCQVTVTLSDESGNVLATSPAMTPDIGLSGLLWPGGMLPYKAIFEDPPMSYEKIEVDLETKPGSSTTIYRFALETLQTTLVFPSPDPNSLSPNLFEHVKVVGRVKNNEPEAVETVQVLGAVYGPDGRIVSVGEGHAFKDRIEPGDTSPFEVEFEGAEVVERYELAAYGFKADK